MTVEYDEFLARKRRHIPPAGFDANAEGFGLFPFQAATVEWALHLGRAAIFADTGLGKTAMQLVWAHRVAEHTGKPILLLAPLAVAEQTRREAIKFGVPDVRVVRDGAEVLPGINITNYERLHRFDGIDVGGVVLDESSILKSFNGKIKAALVARFADVPYRLACTATPAPNDHVELGTHAEFLGVMTRTMMMARWFINDLSNTVAPWRLKKHAVESFWAWVTSWARCIGKPSDMGDYDDEGYDLPALNIHRHSVSVDITDDAGDGMLFRAPELSATQIHREKRRTAIPRAEAAAAIVAAEPDESWLVWCETNYDADALRATLPLSAFEVRGSHKPEQKAERLLRFADEGGVMFTKPGIAGMGLNYQHCARQVFVGLSFSYERFYQAVRRSWRFGQTRPVDAHVIMAPTEAVTWKVIQRKQGEHEIMKVSMFSASRRAVASAARRGTYFPTPCGVIPTWLHTEQPR